MGLSCDCGDGDYEWFYELPDDFSTMHKNPGIPCCSCKKAIGYGATVLKFECMDIEDKPIPNKYLCEKCGDLYLSFVDLGFCDTSPDQLMTELLAEYHETYGRKTA